MPPLPVRLRQHLCTIASRAAPISYQALAKDLGLMPPNTIHQLTCALERLMEEDAATGHPFIAALVVSKSRSGLPAPGFFDCARRLGRHLETASLDADVRFHAGEFGRTVIFWKSPQ